MEEATNLDYSEQGFAITSTGTKIITILLVLILNLCAIYLPIELGGKLGFGFFGSLFAICLIFINFGLEGNDNKTIEKLSLIIGWISIMLLLRFCILLSFNFFLNYEFILFLISSIISCIIISIVFFFSLFYQYMKYEK